MLLLLACISPRPLDAEPVRSRLETPLPAGQVDVGFTPVTSGDQGRAVEPGLAVIVEVGADRYTQVIASCKSAGTGTVDLPGPGVLAMGDCDDRRIEARMEDGAVVVTDSRGEPLTRIPLP